MDNNSATENNSFEPYEIDFGSIFDLILRNKKFIFVISLLSFVIACFYSLTKKRVWEGQFQIVLSSPELTSNNKGINSLSLLAGIDSSAANDLKTEVGILESPSVLMPIFNFVNNEKERQKENDKNFSFSSWKTNNLDISLKKGTSILNISYRDFDKNLILPVLDKMTKIYQEYSGRNRIKTRNLLNKYYDEQISIFKIKSAESLKSAQDFALEQDLIFLDYENSNVNESPEIIRNNEIELLSSLPSTDVEIVRVKAANAIRNLNNQISKIENLKNSMKEIPYIVATIPALVEEGLPKMLNDMDKKIALLNSKYTKKDPNIIRLEEERKRIIENAKERSLGILKARKLVEQAKMEAAMRPKGVLVKYKELLREASRNEITLINLENQFNALNLEYAKQQDPWELITDPTLLTNPVAPNRKSIALSGLFIGFFLSIAIFIYLEKKSGLIFNRYTLESKLDAPFIETFPISDTEINDNKIAFLKDFFVLNKKKNISLMPLGEVSIYNINKLKEKLSLDNVKKDNLISFDDQIEEFLAADIRIIILKLGSITVQEISNFKKSLKLRESGYSGVILLEN